MLRIIFLALLLFMQIEAKTVCLNMIVKNESKVIQRCLESVKGTIDYWVIVDTGSTDGTQKLIRECLKDIPGELIERPWVDFGHNRQEALLYAKGKSDYILFMDADERLVVSKKLANLDKDYYYIYIRGSTPDAVGYQSIKLINSQLNWAWKDVLHEYLVLPPTAKTHEILSQVVCLTDSDGKRSEDPEKYLKDAAVLEKALLKDPTNPRYVFYLAISYHKAGKLELALKNYEKRASMKSGWEKEIFWSLYSAAKLQEELHLAPELFTRTYSKAYEEDPSRAEPLFRLALHFNSQHNFLVGYALAKLALALPIPKDGMFVEQWIYDFALTLECANAAFMLGKYDESVLGYQKLTNMNLPKELETIVQNNFKLAKEKNK